MNNGVENNQTVEPVLVPQDPNAAPGVAGVSPNVVDANPTTVYNVPETAPETAPPEEEKQEDPPKKRRGSPFATLLFILLVGVGAYAYYLKTTTENTIKQQKYICTPASESKEEVALDVNSTLVQDLYQRVATNILEDVSQPEWNDTMKVYLAYRQVPSYKYYESNCNLFRPGKMEPYVCEENNNIKPKAFKVETLELEWKKLFGETTKMPKINAHLQNGCVGDYEYIPESEEYVQCICKNIPTTTLKVKKELVEAVTSNHTLILKEKVEYMGTDKTEVPSYLVSGEYFYTFRLDLNYNYVLISKQYNQKYE